MCKALLPGRSAVFTLLPKVWLANLLSLLAVMQLVNFAGTWSAWMFTQVWVRSMHALPITSDWFLKNQNTPHDEATC
jgi:hypothetical protein